ncbi:nucleoside triphosphate pyrophosphohydrolase [Gulosibacter macacae]|uniref:Nucleoside triphosphate pyrophosphohydrolase n=1 Tax=Gulosibacter macacae TaxID=2488791 RepID=A0A3P3W0J4_9MICO|nr:MazG family protein [Gulosibacter macacae]RRJ86403.1 nucleoside triphosphate pyrophosphohydrolase [Gulosibacter macacae]
MTIDPAPASEHEQLLRLIALVDRFRGKGGCAWYEAQTNSSLVPYLQEETAELVEAIEAGTPDDIREELGDVLFQVLFHTEIGGALGAGFDLEAVARDQIDKLERRNPHVFGATPTRDIDEIIRMWNDAKAIEKAQRNSVLDGVAFGMPALALADKVLGKGAGLVDTAPEALAAEVSGEAQAEDAFGDALLATVAAGREAGFDAERALRGAVRRLADRIRAAE